MKKGITLGTIMLVMVLAISWTVMGATSDGMPNQDGRKMDMGFQDSENQKQEQLNVNKAEKIGHVVVNGKKDSLPVIEGTVYEDNDTMTGVVSMGSFNVKISQNMD